MNASFRTVACTALFAAAATIQTASGAITSVTGNVIQIGAPASALPGALPGLNAWAWDEAQNVSLGGMPVDMITNPSSTSAPVFGVLSGVYDSHFLHFEGTTGTVAFGTITFSGTIQGVQYRDQWLDLSDPLVTLGTIYPTGMPFRGAVFNASVGSFLSINNNVLTFQMLPTFQPNDVEQVRIFTKPIPTPGATAALALAGLVGLRRRR
jgi:hypothetical protein